MFDDTTLAVVEIVHISFSLGSVWNRDNIQQAGIMSK